MKTLTYRLEGSCKQCGDCCRDMEITYSVGDELRAGGSKVKGPLHLRLLLEEAGLDVTNMTVAAIKDGCLAEPDMTVCFECARLQPDGRCGNYENRLNFCRSYPDEPTVELAPTCGFRWVLVGAP